MTCSARSFGSARSSFSNAELDGFNQSRQIVGVSMQSVKAPTRRNFPGTDPATRKRMRSVPSMNTRLEQRVRSALRGLGLRPSTRHPILPGKPDIVMQRSRGVIFVHGCFWHGHGRCKKGRTLPKRNQAFWKQKICYNRARDRRVVAKLRRVGWKVVVVWECQTRSPVALSPRGCPSDSESP